ncbi:MAG: SDR family NAD(P)-dependent oxidoreductase [Verrucomicrobiota bacterium]|nr:SDR family NAD(P)-dependent oxidoreductase [Verrucomicrobiota bacterium]
MKRIFITGASSGIGLATAKRLTSAGHEVWGTSRDQARLPPLAHFHPVVLDLARSDSITTAFKQALNEAGHFDVVINNAGSGHFGSSESLPNELLREQFQILVFGQIGLCTVALQAMRQHGSGLLINVSSLAARLPVPYMGAYNAAKAAMASFTLTLQLELKSSDVRVVDLQPADIRTSFNDVVQRSDSMSSGEQARIDHAWNIVDQNMRAAPSPEIVARQIARLIEQPNPPPLVTVGGFFQAIIAPFVFRLLPQRVRVWGLKKYYKL